MLRPSTWLSLQMRQLCPCLETLVQALARRGIYTQ